MYGIRTVAEIAEGESNTIMLVPVHLSPAGLQYVFVLYLDVLQTSSSSSASSQSLGSQHPVWAGGSWQFSYGPASPQPPTCQGGRQPHLGLLAAFCSEACRHGSPAPWERPGLTVACMGSIPEQLRNQSTRRMVYGCQCPRCLGEHFTVVLRHFQSVLKPDFSPGRSCPAVPIPR